MTVYDWADQVANGFPIDEKHPIALAGGLYWASGSTAKSKTFSHPEAGPVSFYVDFAINDTVQRVSTNGAGAISMSGTNSDGTPFWCGPAYPGTPACYRYEGAPGSVTLERLNAEAQLTADSSSAGHNSLVTFSLKSEPAFVEGEEMALSIDKTSWTPDADTLGGDPTDVAASGACTWSGAISNKTCTRNIKSSGTLKVVGGVNGKYFEKTWHISRTDAYPIVTASKYYVSAGQIDTFTVRMSDGSAFNMSNWSWFADSGVKQTVVGCGNFTNPCNNTAVKESGRMRARVVHNSVYKYSQAHVIVGPRPELQLDADKSSIILGDTITFTTSAGDAPYSITSWKYHKTGVAACGTDKTCDHAPMHSGRMWVFGVVDREPDTAFVDIAVRLNSDGTDLSGAAIDSAMLDSAGASKLTVIASDGLDVIPVEGVHLFPSDSVVAYSFVVLPGHIDLAVVRDDTGSTPQGTVNMSRDHVLEGETRPDWLLNADIVDTRNRYRLLLTASDKKLAYASMLTRYSGLAARTSPAYANWTFSIADLLAFDVSRSDSTALRALDDALAGTLFFTTKCGDSLVFHPETKGNCQLVALRSAESQMANVSFRPDSGFSHILYVNGINNTRKEADETIALLPPIVAQTTFGAQAETYLFYNPTFKEQQKGWSTLDRACAALVRRWLPFLSGRLIALSDMAECLGEQFLRSKVERDLFEALAAKLDVEYDVFSVPNDIVDQLAAFIPPLLGGGRSVIFVAHSQGNLIVEQAMRRAATSTQLNVQSSHCTALLSLATPLSPTSFILPDSLRRHLTVKHDILRQLGMEYNVFSLETPISEEADDELEQINPITQPLKRLATELYWGVQVHGAGPNYFQPLNSQVIVRNRLEQLRTACYP